MAEGAALNDALDDFLDILTEHRRNCERLGRYVEAEIARKRIEEVRAHEEQRKREGVLSRQLAELLALEEAHMLEFQQFNALWDAKMAAFEANALVVLDAMRVRHADALRDFQQKLIAKALAPRHSAEYLNLRVVQDKLAALRNYGAAAKMKEKADELMAYEEEKGSNERQAEMLKKEDEYKRRLGGEAATMRERIAQGRAEQNRLRQKSLEQVRRAASADVLGVVGSGASDGGGGGAAPRRTPRRLLLSLTRSPPPPLPSLPARGRCCKSTTTPRRRSPCSTRSSWASSTARL